MEKPDWPRVRIPIPPCPPGLSLEETAAPGDEETASPGSLAVQPFSRELVSEANSLFNRENTGKFSFLQGFRSFPVFETWQKR